MNSILAFKSQAHDIRQTIITKAARDGGHVAPPLGAVEIIQALTHVFDFTKHKITFDVGHQMHAYKILTDRADTFSTMGKKDGLCMYSDPSESDFDFYIGGHSGTSISAALGYAIHHSEYKSIAFIGDGAMTGGQPFEALNQAGYLSANILVIYNDNDYSTTKNTGFLACKKRLNKFAGSLGFKYIGVIDGHDTKKLIKILQQTKTRKYPIFLHIKTKKGKGYKPAEQDPVMFHNIAPFNIDTGRLKQPSNSKLTDTMVSTASCLRQKYDNLYFVTPAASRHLGFTKIQQMFPEYTFDTGINEQHCVTFAASLALNKNRVICFIPATFLPRAFDQIIDVCMQKIPIVFVLLCPGIGDTGPTHQGIYTFGMLNMLPNAKLLNSISPEDFACTLTCALKNNDGPVFIQKPREDIKLANNNQAVDLVCDGSDLTVIPLGNTLGMAQKLVQNLPNLQILNIKQIIPVDIAPIYKYVQKTGKVLILEDGLINSGVGQHIIASICTKMPVKYKILGVQNYIQNGTFEQVYQQVKLDDQTILKNARDLIG